MNQDWTSTLKTRLYGEVRLNQGFYAHAGPQGFGDRDDHRTEFGVEVAGKINSKMTATSNVYVIS